MAQIEHEFNANPEFSLQKLWFFVHPTLHTLSLLHKLVLALSPSGGSPDETSEEESDANESDDEAAQRRRAALGLAPLPAALRKAPSPNGAQATTSSYSEFPIIGGEVLTILSSLKQLHSGDPDATVVYSALWHQSGIPYARMLNMWVRKGVWKDRWDEACIRETKWSGVAAGGDEEWERRYTVRAALYC
jgi:gamma-tubulin complex component 2